MLRLIAAIMDFAVDFDSQADRQTGEIDSITDLWILAPKLEAAGAIAQFLPEQHLGERHVASVGAGLTYVLR